MKAEAFFSTYKMSGAGNTFALIDARPGSDFSEVEKNGFPLRKDWVPQLCDPREGLGVDGVLLLEEGRGDADYTWDFYNADGSGAEMCGNAARCAALFCRDVIKDIQKREFRFLTGAGVVKVRVDVAGIFTVEMTRGQIKSKNLNLLSEHGPVSGFWIDTGVPHFVIPVTEFSEIPLIVCRTLRSHRDLGPAGANITLLRRRGLLQGEAVTYERGVENFTAACGTGAVAAALALGSGAPGSYAIRMPGGDLQVEVGGENPKLSGPALLLGEYRPNQEMFP